MLELLKTLVMVTLLCEKREYSNGVAQHIIVKICFDLQNTLAIFLRLVQDANTIVSKLKVVCNTYLPANLSTTFGLKNADGSCEIKRSAVGI